MTKIVRLPPTPIFDRGIDRFAETTPGEPTVNGRPPRAHGATHRAAHPVPTTARRHLLEVAPAAVPTARDQGLP